MTDGKWSLRWEEHTFTDDDAEKLTVAELAVVQTLAGAGWSSANPLLGPNQAASVLAVLVAKAEHRDPFAVMAEIGARPAIEIMKAIGPNGQLVVTENGSV